MNWFTELSLINDMRKINERKEGNK